MQHAVPDGEAAAGRARRGYAPGWHPVLAAVEAEPGTWYMVAQYGRCYGVVRLLTIGGERGYRVVSWAPRGEDRRLIGYYRSLRSAAAAAHRVMLDSYGSRSTGEYPLQSRRQTPGSSSRNDS